MPLRESTLHLRPQFVDNFDGRRKYQSIFAFPDLWYSLEKVHFGMSRNAIYAADVRFLQELIDAYSPIPVQHVLEVACGICPHGRLLTALGYDVTGIDYSEPMLEAARRMCKSEGLPIRLYKRNSESFTLPAGRRFDAAICLAETLPCGFATETGEQFNAAMINHLQSMANVVKPGGLYVLDFGRRSSLYKPSRATRRVDFPGEWYQTRDAVLYRKVSKPPDDIYNNIHYTVQRCTVLFSDGSVLNTYDKWRGPWQFPLPYLSTLARSSGTFRLLSAHEWQQTEPGVKLHEWNYVWVVLQRT